MKIAEIIYAGFLVAVCVIFYFLRIIFDIPGYVGIFIAISGLILLIWGVNRMKKEDKGQVKDWPWSKK